MPACGRRMKAQPRMLQTQIEPHFLFNILANAGRLADGDPEPAINRVLLTRRI